MIRPRSLARLLALVSALTMLLATVAGAQAATPSDAPADAIAHPTFHVRNRPAATTPSGLTPTQIRHAYGFDQLSATGSGQVIGIVDAYDDPSVAKDLNTYISTYGLAPMNGLPGQPTCSVSAGPHPCFQKVYSGSKPRSNGSWALEISLDVQSAHAVAPGADILLVEAPSSGTSALLKAVDTAVNDGAHVVSMSWGAAETSTETTNDSHFNKSGVTFTASAGDSGTGTIWPSVSPYVVSVGGTTLNVDSAGNVQSELAWSGSGGGISTLEAEPGYQASFPIPGTNGERGDPDVSYNADPNTGLAIYDSTAYSGQTGWFQVGGTSAGSPAWAATIALADQSRSAGPLSSSNLTSSAEYNAGAGAVYATNYRDVTSGTNGTCSVCSATPGYDFVTGLGSPLANSLVPYLSSH